METAAVTLSPGRTAAPALSARVRDDPFVPRLTADPDSAGNTKGPVAC